MTERREPTFEEIAAAADAMISYMFAPHELPLCVDLRLKYLECAKRALQAAMTYRQSVIADMQWELERRGNEIASLHDLLGTIRRECGTPWIEAEQARKEIARLCARALDSAEQQAPITTEALDQAQFGKTLHKRPSDEQKMPDNKVREDSNGTVKRVEYHAPHPVITGTPSREPLGQYTIQGTQGRSS
jgi:hypothetical protein